MKAPQLFEFRLEMKAASAAGEIYPCHYVPYMFQLATKKLHFVLTEIFEKSSMAVPGQLQ